MSDLFRDTVFGQAVCLLFRNRLLEFPDELDPILWKQCVQKDTMAVSSSSGEHNGFARPSDHTTADVSDGGERGQKEGAGVTFAHDSRDENVSYQGNPSYEKVIDAVVVGCGYGLSPILFSPMSEMPTIGRSRIYFWTLFAFVLLQLPTGYAVNMAVLLVFRYLTGFFGGPVLATGGATIIDMYPPTEVAYWMGIFGGSGVLGPVIGPLVGGFAAQAKGWRWTIWELAWLCAVVLIVLFFLMPETNSANILYRRAQRMRKATSDWTLKSQSEMDAAEVTVKDHLVVLGRAFTLTSSEPVIFFVDLYSALLYGQGLVFWGIFVGRLITVPCYLVHWMVPHVGSVSFTVSIITLFMPVLSYLCMAYPQYAASVLAGNTLFRASCGVVFPLFYGQRIRHRSKNATHDV
ncbi:major facilitator superfamily domain-containing protein [Lineolata rhizophorae]|uniref:Major facilitator superfamily domain-containing protein n=1 Tax=Lineolata rhizophorae TaxID=578093 RepID=A0A6A6PDI9_9PEZI|nr:major facilitator superfamily domain-containing protein [Lineolata rhizophorae]